MGEPGQPGDVKRIEHVALRIADGYAQAIEWTLEFHRVNVEPELQKLMTLASELSGNVLNEIEQFASTLFDKVSYTLANHAQGDVVEFTLALTVPDCTAFNDEIQRVSRLSES